MSVGLRNGNPKQLSNISALPSSHLAGNVIGRSTYISPDFFRDAATDTERGADLLGAVWRDEVSVRLCTGRFGRSASPLKPLNAQRRHWLGDFHRPDLLAN